MISSNDNLRVKQFKIVIIIFSIAYIIDWIMPFVTEVSGHAYGSLQNLSNLRITTNYNWSAITLFAAVSFAYALEMDKKNWSGILAGLTFVLMDVFNEIWNGLLFTATNQYAAPWMCGYTSSYQVLIGWNIEIIFCFFLFGLCITKGLPKDKNALIFGKINNRIAVAVGWAMLGFIVELVLNSFGALIWNYWWWSARFPFLIMLTAYLPFTTMALWVYDLPSTKSQIKVVGTLAAVFLTAYVVFIFLGWI